MNHLDEIVKVVRRPHCSAIRQWLEPSAADGALEKVCHVLRWRPSRSRSAVSGFWGRDTAAAITVQSQSSVSVAKVRDVGIDLVHVVADEGCVKLGFQQLS